MHHLRDLDFRGCTGKIQWLPDAQSKVLGCLASYTIVIPKTVEEYATNRLNHQWTIHKYMLLKQKEVSKTQPAPKLHFLFLEVKPWRHGPSHIFGPVQQHFHWLWSSAASHGTWKVLRFQGFKIINLFFFVFWCWVALKKQMSQRSVSKGKPEPVPELEELSWTWQIPQIE